MRTNSHSEFIVSLTHFLLLARARYCQVCPLLSDKHV